jgi:hypothetical protein
MAFRIHSDGRPSVPPGGIQQRLGGRRRLPFLPHLFSSQGLQVHQLQLQGTTPPNFLREPVLQSLLGLRRVGVRRL